MRGAPRTVDTHLAIVLQSYFVARTDHLPSAKPARDAGRLLLEKAGPLAKASAVNDTFLHDFAADQVRLGNSLNYVARIFSVLSAAFGRADLPRRHIPIKEAAIIEKWPDLKAKPRRKIFEPTDDDLARLLRQDMPQSLHRWLLNSMATAGRPMAVAQLAPAQRDRDHDLIALNPEDRRQNKKFRPTVREPKAMTKWLGEWEKPKGKRGMPPTQRYCLYASRSSIHTALRRACAADKANLPKMALYSLRHRATTVMRNAKVRQEEIDFQLGHIPKGAARTTHDYGQYEPGYLSDAAKALDAWVARVLKLAAQKPKTEKIRRAA